MRRIVRSDAVTPLVLGVIAGVLVIVTEASTGAAYLITLSLGAIGLAPEQIRLRRETHGMRSSRQRKRASAGGE